ncbi:MAG: exonuclease domain-containing protein [Candidatus Omnitrophota bacterium]|jgi:DNA polymerase III epsilon subunit family exonuclease
MSLKLDDTEFVIFDTETTGLEPEAGDRVVEIAALRFKGDNRIATFQTLLNPKRPISAAAFAVNNISQEMLKDAPEAEAMLPEFLNFIQGSCLCSYNAGFDLKFLNNELKLINMEPLKGVQVVDILKMARRLLPGQERYALWFIARQLGINIQQEHRAFSDVELTFGVFNRLKELLFLKGIFDFKSFHHLFSIDKSFLENILAQRIAEIQEAINLGMSVKIKYLSSSGAEVTEREVVPKEIRKENGRSYMVGYCCLKQEERTFRVDGILHLEAL